MHKLMAKLPTDKPPPDDAAAFRRQDRLGEKPAVLVPTERQRRMVMASAPRATSLPNIHRIVSDGIAIIELELQRLREKSGLGGLNPSESKQLDIYLKAIGTLTDAEDRASGTVGSVKVAQLTDPELRDFAQAALAALGQGLDDKGEP